MDNENRETDNLSLEDLVKENYNVHAAQKILDDFENLPFAITDMEDATDNGGAYYDYVKECIAKNTVPSGVDFCSRFLKDGKYVFEDVSADTYEEFINSDDLINMYQL